MRNSVLSTPGSDFVVGAEGRVSLMMDLHRHRNQDQSYRRCGNACITGRQVPGSLPALSSRQYTAPEPHSRKAAVGARKT